MKNSTFFGVWVKCLTWFCSSLAQFVIWSKTSISGFFFSAYRMISSVTSVEGNDLAWSSFQKISYIWDKGKGLSFSSMKLLGREEISTAYSWLFQVKEITGCLSEISFRRELEWYHLCVQWSSSVAIAAPTVIRNDMNNDNWYFAS